MQGFPSWIPLGQGDTVLESSPHTGDDLTSGYTIPIRSLVQSYAPGCRSHTETANWGLSRRS